MENEVVVQVGSCSYPDKELLTCLIKAFFLVIINQKYCC